MRKIRHIRIAAIKKRGDGSVRELILLLSGIYSILLILRAVPHVTFSSAAVFAAVTAVCIGLYVLSRIRKNLVWAGSAGILLFCAVLGAVRRDLCTVQLGAFAAGLTNGSAQGEESVTFLILLAGTALSAFFSCLSWSGSGIGCPISWSRRSWRGRLSSGSARGSSR